MHVSKQSSSFTLTFLTLLLIAVHLPLSAPATCNADDQKALENLKNYFGTTDASFYNWWWFIDCCYWNGIGCDSNGRVISMSLQLKPYSIFSRQFEIPSIIEDLPKLKHLKLSVFWGSFIGPIPRAMAHLYELEHLDLSGNQLNGTIPGFMGQLEGLKHIDVSNNKLSGQIPVTLGFLARLTKLKLGSNQLDGPIPSNIDQCSGLETLDLSNNMLNGSIPLQLGNLTSLETLDLSSNKLDGNIPITLGRLQWLSVLDLHDNKLNGTIPPQLGQALSLNTLDLSDNQLCGPIPDLLSKFKLESFQNNKCLCDKPLKPCEKLSLVQEKIEQVLPFIK